MGQGHLPGAGVPDAEVHQALPVEAGEEDEVGAPGLALLPQDLLHLEAETGLREAQGAGGVADEDALEEGDPEAACAVHGI